jgi:hypothetical protein
MGFFSWKTADSDLPINNIHSSDPHSKPVYLLSPDGKHIKEDGYNGYGVFGNVDAYSWLAVKNEPEAVRSEVISALKKLEGDKSDVSDGRVDSIISDLMDSSKSIDDGLLYSVNNEVRGVGITLFFHSNTELVYPLKFSFNPDSIYQVLDKSANDPSQGFFIDNDIDYEDEDDYEDESFGPK